MRLYAPTLDDFPGISTVCLRLPWVYLESEEGAYNWAILDTPAQRWIANGKRILVLFQSGKRDLRSLTSYPWIKAGFNCNLHIPLKSACEFLDFIITTVTLYAFSEIMEWKQLH